MKHILSIIIGLTVWSTQCIAIKSADVKVIIVNNQEVQRTEVIEVDFTKIKMVLALKDNEPVIVKNLLGQQVDYQLTYDDKLLIDVSVRPLGEATFIVTRGIPIRMKKWVDGNMYPTRKDDIAWENDRGAYRVYGPALQRSGEKANGIDVWTKCTPELVVADRYNEDFSGNVRKNKFARTNRKAEWNEENLKTSFHLNHGNGLDCYKVGPTLGCGTPALMVNEELFLPYCYEDYEILDNGPLRFTLSLTFHPVNIGKNKNVVEHRIISLDKGSNFNSMTVWYDGLTMNCDLASGVVVHTEDTHSVNISKNYVAYADPTDNQQVHNCQVYVAALFPNGATTRLLPYDKPSGDVYGHALGVIKNIKNKKKYTYYFGSAWSNYDVRSFNEWQLRIDEYMNALHNPLNIEIK